MFINDQPALRTQDTGNHSSCCGPNHWLAIEGCGTVLINNRLAHRLDDLTKHCGGSGKLVCGSSDVLIGTTNDGLIDNDELPEQTWLDLSSLDEQKVAIPYQPLEVTVAGKACIAISDGTGIFKAWALPKSSEVELALLCRTSDDPEEGAKNDCSTVS